MERVPDAPRKSALPSLEEGMGWRGGVVWWQVVGRVGSGSLMECHVSEVAELVGGGKGLHAGPSDLGRL